MSFFRSEPMTLCQMILHTESAFDCLIVLGYEGKVQFRNIFDGNISINNQYKNEERRCQELKRILSYLQQKVTENNIKKVIYPDVDMDEAPEADDLKNIETEVQEIYDDLKDIGGTVKVLIDKRLVLYESLQVVQKADAFFGTMPQASQPLLAFSDSVTKLLMKNELNVETQDGQRLSFFSGTIPVNKFNTFEILLWRVTKGFFHLKHEEYIPTTEEKAKIFPTEFSRKYVFLVFFMGQEFRNKISKMCQGFGIKLFECPESQFERRTLRENLKKELFDLDVVIRHTQDHLNELLQVVATDLYIWQVKVQKIFMVYYVLNRMSRIRHLHVNKYLQAEGWIPTKDIPTVRRALNFGARRAAKGNFASVFQPILNEKPHRREHEFEKPTLFELNKFTKGFQNLIDSYGIAQYQELNPAPYTIITFPFLFAVMFGDMGHGLILLLFGMWMILKENSLEEKIRFGAEQNEIFNILFTGRYVIALMGAFSVYTGFIYNDCFSKSFNIFGSSWMVPDALNFVNYTQYNIRLKPYMSFTGIPYPLGLDPMWDVAGDNSITTYNSLKMKMSIILGVTQMIFGLILSAFNFAYKSEYVDLILVFLPQITFLVCIFLYLVFLIFFKWIHYGEEYEPAYSTECAPSVLIMFINMLMMKANDEPPEGCDAWMFDEQPYLQSFLLTMALVSVPVLLAGKPIYYMLQERKIERIKNDQLKSTRSRIAGRDIIKSLVYNVESSTNLEKIATIKNLASENETILSELWIHSGIHCIESILGSVSHTASYLRLWALSLAHEQLSSVLWDLVISIPLSLPYGYWCSIILYFIFMIWAVLTVAILVVMEGLSAFLHTLRLHWVEFQSKFYLGSGEPFRPFKFEESSPNNII